MTIEEQRREQMRKYRGHLANARQLREKAIAATSVDERRRLLNASDEARARAYHEVA